MSLVGQVLDGKYQMTRELGRGGMGTVYLATHLGTERPVAVKVIAPQFMERAEFVERFRREARAAGRLRHPNVVNVTDFGFSDTSDGQVAYLVMEYLDGCTLGEILDEERNLPVGWTLDILDQVCSAVHEAHTQGIIHRDLKPDNIWLEPNQRGGYTVKVLDFGIAKLEDHVEAPQNGGVPQEYRRSTHTVMAGSGSTFSGLDGDTIAGGQLSNTIATAPTVAAAPSSEGTTVIYDKAEEPVNQDTVGTRVMQTPQEAADPTVSGGATIRSLYDSASSGELTRVGAVLGTPLYMSPEQCRGEHLDARSDVYSLGVIAYQMLSGGTPFNGDYKDVMEAHKATEPPPLDAPRVRRKLKRAIHTALAKDPDKRPQTAEAFISELRSRSEGIFGLLRRAMVIYSEHLAKFIMITGFFSLPVIVLTIILLGLAFLRVTEVISGAPATVLMGTFGFLLSIANAFSTSLLVGTIAWIVTQYLAVPLRPVRLRPALAAARRNWKRIVGAGLLTALIPMLILAVVTVGVFITLALLVQVFFPGTLFRVQGFGVRVFESGTVPLIICAALSGLLGFAAFVWTYISLILVPPVVMLEKVKVREALRRSKLLVKRSFITAAAAVFIMLLIPAIIAGSISAVVNITAKAIDPKPKAEAAETATAEARPPDAVPGDGTRVGYSIGQSGVRIDQTEEKNMRNAVRRTVLESLVQIFWLPMQIFVFSFSAIIVALLYLKTRLAGGESMQDLIERFEDDGRPRKKWQERVRQRLIQSGRIPSKP